MKIREPQHFIKRIGLDPHAGGAITGGLASCPDIWEVDTGDFAVIGIRATKSLLAKLPASASCGPDEEMVIIPRRLLIGAKNDIPTV